MPDEASRLLGLVGLRVLGVVEGDGDALELEVESVAHAEPCPHCEGEDLVIKERPVVRVRDLPLAGRVVRLRWRKRRFSCRRCGRTHTRAASGAGGPSAGERPLPSAAGAAGLGRWRSR